MSVRGLLLLAWLGAGASAWLGAESPAAALVRHAPTINGTVEGSVQVMTAENVTLNSNAAVKGNLLVPGMPAVRLNGRPTYGGTQDGSGAAAPSNYSITLNSGAALGHVVRRTDPVSLPPVARPPAPTGMRSVSLDRASQNPGAFTTLRNLTLNSKVGQIVVPPGTYGNFIANAGSGFTLGVAGATTPALYNFQNLTLNSNSSLLVVGPVIVTVDGGFSTNSPMGAADHPEWLDLRIAGGGLSLASNVQVYGYVKAPEGTITLNGGSRITGGTTSDRLSLNSGAVLRLIVANQPPTVTLTSPAAGASVIAFKALTLTATATDADGTIARVEFYNGATKLGDGTPRAGFPSIFDLGLPTGLPAGTYAFTARATDNVGAATTSAPVAISVTLIPNAPPQVALTAPAAGATLAANMAVTLSATATDTDGTVAKIEFFDGAAKLGETSTPTSTSIYDLHFTVGFLPGSRRLIARATDDGGAFADSVAVAVAVLATVPYTADFEAAEGYALGSLAGQLGWNVTQGAARVTDEAFFSGARSVLLPSGAPRGKIAQAFAPLAGQNVVFVDFFAKPVADADLNAATIFDVESSRFALARDGTNGLLRAFNGDGAGGGQWNDTAFTIPLAADGSSQDWVRLTARVDFARKTWDLYANGALVAADLAFRDVSCTALSAFGVQGHTVAPTRLDYLLAATQNPLFADADNDGMDDAWENANGLNPTVNDRNGDLDGDGLSNLREYQLRLKPNNPDSDGDGLYDGDEVAWGWGPVTPNPDTTAPTAPTGLTAGVTTDTINLSWQPATDNLRVAGYLVYRNGQPLETPQPIRDTHYADAGLPENESFGYQVRAFDFAGNLSPLSGRISVHTPAADADGNGLPDYWEQKYFPQGGADPNADDDGDGITNIQEYRSGTDPKDFYNGVVPIHDVLFSGQPGPADQLGMIVRKPDGSPWPNAPVDFDITSGRRRISATPGGPYSFHVTVRADGNGLAQCYLEPLLP